MFSFTQLKVYYKAAHLVPFYTSIALAILEFGAFWTYSENYFWYAFEKALHIPVYSGLIGLSGLTLFLNRRDFIGRNTLKIVLSWYLLPLLAIIIIVLNLDWSRIGGDGPKFPIPSILTCIIAFLHLIGISISFRDFYASIKIFEREQLLKA